MANIVATCVDKITLYDFVRLSSELGMVFDIEWFFIFFLLVLHDDILGYCPIVHYYVVEFPWIYVFFYSIYEVDHFHIGCLTALGHSITDIDDFCSCLLQGLSHTNTEKVRYYSCEEISRPDDDIVCFEYGIFGIGIEIPLFSYEPCIDDILIEIV